MFADDTSVFMSNKSIDVLVKTINIELKFVGEWFKANKLSLNLVKTNFILFCSQRKTELKSDCNIAINIDNQCIARVSSTKFLDVHIDEHLTWKEHVAVISKKISKNIGIISRIRHLLPRHILVNLYYTLIYPYMSYCNLVWTSTYRNRLTTLMTLQKRVVRIIMNVPYRAHTISLFYNLKILPFEYINKLQVGSFMYKFQAHQLPTGFDNWFCKNSEVYDHITRSAMNYHQRRVNTTARQHSIVICGPLLWNSLPNHLTNLPTVYQFKRKLKFHFLASLA